MLKDGFGPSLPALVLTVAITGHQDIPAALHSRLRAKVQALLGQTRLHLVTKAELSALDSVRPISCRFVSALAPGADQIGACAALALRESEAPWQLHAVLPFARDVSAALAAATLQERGVDTAEAQAAVAAIADLAGKADRVLELADWQPDAPALVAQAWQSRRYATIGQLLVRRADLLIALWDGNPARGTGGTADVVTQARRCGVPVIWINPGAPDDAHSLVPDPDSNHLPASDLLLRWSTAAAGSEDQARFGRRVIEGGEAAIAAAIAQVLLGEDPKRAACVERYLAEPPAELWQVDGSDQPPEPGDRFTAYARMLFWFLNWPSRKTRPPSAEERARGEGAQPLRSNPFAKARRDGTAARRKVLRYRFDFGARPDTPGTANAAPMLGHAARADALATRLSNQYRSAYVWIFALAPVAVMWAVLSVLFKEWKPLLVVFELVTVSSVAAIYLRTRAQDPVAERRSPPGWLRRLFPRSQDTHQRWLDARLIAESQRSGQLLAWAGFAGRRPIDPPSGTAAGHGDHHGDHLAKDHHAAPRPLWAPHYANAIAALPELPLDEEAGTPQAVITPRRIVALAEAAGTVIAGQTGYHDLNHRQLEALNHRLDTFSLRAIQWAAGFSLAYLVFWAVSQPVPGWAPWSAVLAKGSPVRAVRQDMSDNQQATG